MVDRDLNNAAIGELDQVAIASINVFAQRTIQVCFLHILSKFAKWSIGCAGSLGRAFFACEYLLERCEIALHSQSPVSIVEQLNALKT